MVKKNLLLIANESIPVYFEVADELETYSLITPETARGLNIKIPADAPDVTVPLRRRGVSDRTLLGPQVSIKSIRIGQHVFKDVPAIVLRVGDSDLGNILSRRAFSYYSADNGKYLYIIRDPEKVRLERQKADEIKREAERKKAAENEKAED